MIIDFRLAPVLTLCGSLLACLTADLLAVQTTTQTPSSVPTDKPFLSGIVQSADGTAAANVTVFLISGPYDKPEKLAETKTNELGKFAFSDPKLIDPVTEHYSYSTLMAVDGTNRLGWLTGLYAFRRLDQTITLLELKPFSGTLIDADDKPIAGAAINLKTLFGGPSNSSGRNSVSLPSSLLANSVLKTDQQGKFSLIGTQGGAVLFDLTPDGSSENKITIRGNSGADAVVKLRRGVLATGKVELPAERTADKFSQDLGKVTLWGNQKFDSLGEKTTKDEATVFVLQQELSAPIKADLSFEFPNLLEGTYRLHVKFEQETRLLSPQKLRKWKVEAGQPPLELLAGQASVLTGKVISYKTKKPIAGAQVRVAQRVDGHAAFSTFPTTDDQGAYSANVPNGSFTAMVSRAPDGFIRSPDIYDSKLRKERNPRFEVSGDTAAPNIELDSATDVTIEVTDEDGEPVEGAIVKVVVPVGYPDGEYDQPTAKTDVNGRYVIRGVTDDDTIPIWVRSANGVSEFKTIDPSEFAAPVSIVLSSEGLRFRVKVVDDNDKPIQGAKVHLGTYYRYQSKWIDSNRGTATSGGAGSGVTDSQGNFESGPLWPNSGYKISVTADGYVRARFEQGRKQRKRNG